MMMMMDKDEEAQAELEVWRYVFGFSDFAIVKCAIELGIADAIEAHGKPMPLAELSAAVACRPSSLYRIMRFLVQRRVFGERRDAGYSLTPISRRLLKNGERSRAAFVLFENDPSMLLPWHAISARLRGEERVAFELAYGKDMWAFVDGQADKRALIDNAMACDARTVVPVIVEGCPGIFEGVGTVADVGGGNGMAMRTLVGVCPWIKGVNFDLPSVISAAPKWPGVEHVAGDMFVAVPKADVVFLKWVLHDWEDEECVQILRKCKEAVPKEKGKVIVVEAVITEEVEEPGLRDIRLMLDMVMIAHTKGKERTEMEWKNIIMDAGFSGYNIRPIPALQSVIECLP
ncbi:hypothetical protein ACLOJK_002290 [Asimina triloba]